MMMINVRKVLAPVAAATSLSSPAVQPVSEGANANGECYRLFRSFVLVCETKSLLV